MSYSAIPGIRRAFHLDGSAVYYNTSGYTYAWTQVTGANLAALNTANGYGVVSQNGGSFYVFIAFPELIDLAAIAVYGLSYPHQGTWNPIQYSPNTTTGADGTWTNLPFTTTGSTYPNIQGSASGGADWYRYPSIVGSGTVAAAQTGVKAIRWSVDTTITSNAQWQGLVVYGNKSSGQTPDDLVFYSDSAATTPLTAETDWGNVPVGTTATMTLYLKNTSTTKTASSVALSFGDSNSGDYTVSIDGGTTYAATQTVTSMAPGAIQRVDLKNAPTGTLFGSHAAYLEVNPGTFA